MLVAPAWTSFGPAVGASGSGDDEKDLTLLEEESPATGERPSGEHPASGGGRAAAGPGEAHAADAHGEGGRAEPKPLLELPEFLPNLLSFVTFRPELHHNTVVQWLHVFAWENIVFSVLTAVLILALVALLFASARPATEVPTRPQSLLEMVVEALDNLVCGVIGPRGRRYTPFIGSLFLYIWCMNMQGLVPGLKSPTSYLGVTAGLAVTVFFYVQYVGVRENGIFGYLKHLAGSPEDTVGWLMSPLMFVLHTFGEFIKPMSLSLRLFGNIMGEDALIGVFCLLGVVLLSAMGGGPTTLESMMGLEAQYHHAELAWWQPFGLPLQLPFMMLALLTGTIQALVFSLLSTIYIFLMLPHGDHGHSEPGADAAHGGGSPPAHGGGEPHRHGEAGHGAASHGGHAPQGT